MPIHLNPFSPSSQKTMPHSLNRSQPQEFSFISTLSPKSERTSTRWKLRDLFRSFIETIKSWFIWILQCCPIETSKVEVIEEIVENPEGTVEKFLEEPLKSCADLIELVLKDPKLVKKMRQKNRENYTQFIEDFAEKLTEKDLFTGKENVLLEIQSILNPFLEKKEKKEVYTQCLKLLKNHIPTLATATISACKDIIDKLEKEKEDSPSDALKGINELFQIYLPYIARQAKKNPKEFSSFLDKLYDHKTSSKINYFEFINTHLPKYAIPKRKNLDAVRQCLENNALSLRQLHDPDLASKELKLTKAIEIMPIFYKHLLREVTSKQYYDLGRIFSDEFPLLSKVAKRLKAITSNQPSFRKKLSDNFFPAKKLLKTLYSDYTKALDS